MDDLIDTAKVVCGSNRRQVGYAYRIWSANTSFYIKPLIPGVDGVKISIHGRDPRPGKIPMFKATLDDGGRSFDDEANREKAIGYSTGDWPVIFQGKPLVTGGRLIVRIRWTWDSCFRPRMTPIAAPKAKKDQYAGIVHAPTQPGDAADLDLVHSENGPKWQYRAQAERDDAWIGPFTNKSGEYLTGTIIHRSMLKHPNPAASGLHPPQGDDEIRGLWCGVDDDGVLWLLQHRQSRVSLIEAVDRSLSEG